MRLMVLERKINTRLRRIHPGYAIRDLRRLPDGQYWFDLVAAFRPGDLAQVNRVFRELLGAGKESQDSVQAKFYLSTQTVSRLRQEAARRGRSQSRLVEEALRRALA